MGITVTNESFIKNLDSRFPNREYKIISKYKSVFCKILVKNKYGECLMSPDSLLAGSSLSIKSAVDKTKYSLNQIREIHGDKYSYEKYVFKTAKTKSTITCPVHGDFEQTPNKHLNGSGCPYCKNVVKSNIKNLIDKFVLVHTDKYDYSKSLYLGAHIPIKIKCKIHGYFCQSPTNHRKGSGCPRCVERKGTYSFEEWNKYCPNNLGTFYVLKCFNETENFIKIGITCRAVSKRYSSNKRMPYNYEILEKVSLYDRKIIWDLENRLKIKLRVYEYEPIIKFGGSITEVFSIDSLDLINTELKKIKHEQQF